MRLTTHKKSSPSQSAMFLNIKYEIKLKHRALHCYIIRYQGTVWSWRTLFQPIAPIQSAEQCAVTVRPTVRFQFIGMVSAPQIDTGHFASLEPDLRCGQVVPVEWLSQVPILPLVRNGKEGTSPAACERWLVVQEEVGGASSSPLHHGPHHLWSHYAWLPSW